MRLTAKIVPYSSVVGQSIMLCRYDGPCVAMLSIHGAAEPLTKTQAEGLADQLASLINEDGLGLPL